MNHKNTNFLILGFCLIKLLFHFIADFNSGFQGDEFLHIETGNHPAWGYMEFPPVIGWLAAIQNWLGSESVWVHHIFSHIASVLIMVILARLTILLGGKTQAVFIVLLCVLSAPAFGRGHQLFQPVVFSQLSWVLSFYLLALFVKTNEAKYLTYFTITIAFGFLAKFDILFFVAALPVLIFFPDLRERIVSIKSMWLIMLFLVITGPNLYWQYHHGFPVLDMFSRLYETQLNELSIGEVISEMLISTNPLTLPLWLGGLLFIFQKRNKSFYRPLGCVIIGSILLLSFAKSKAYYFYPVVLILFAFGSTWLEQILLQKRKWTIYPIAILLAISGLLMLPFSLSVLPLNQFINSAGIEKEKGYYKIDFSEYTAAIRWPQTLTAIQEVYDSLPTSEKENAMIWGKHYSQAGAVNLYGDNYALPKAFSYHGSFYLWAPVKGELPQTIIAVIYGDTNIEFFEPFFHSLTVAGIVCFEYAKDDKDVCQTIIVCRQPKMNFEEMKKAFSTRIFE